jgi:membrane protein implicated in regulation of membrane protease activity
MALPSGESLALLLVVAGVVLSIMEALAPGAHFVVLGVALLVAGLVALLLPPLATPFALAGLVLAVGGAALWAYRELDLYGGKASGRTRDSSSLAGNTGRAVERITPTSGRVRLDDGGFDPYYSARATSGEIPEGSEVIVMDPGGGSVLIVEQVDGMDEIDRELARERERQEAVESEADAESEREANGS